MVIDVEWVTKVDTVDRISVKVSTLCTRVRIKDLGGTMDIIGKDIISMGVGGRRSMGRSTSIRRAKRFMCRRLRARK
jgi:hypothetical protein